MEQGEGKLSQPESDDTHKRQKTAAHKRDISATGGGQNAPSVSSKDDRISAVAG